MVSDHPADAPRCHTMTGMHRIHEATPVGIAVMAVVLGLAGCTAAQPPSVAPDHGFVSSTPEPTATPGTVEPCVDDIDVHLDRERGSGRAGFLVFTNSGAAACSIAGFPELDAMSADGAVLSTMEQSDLHDLAGTPVVLAQGATAYSWVFWDDTADTIHSCEQVLDAATFRVSIPSMTEPENVDTDAFQLCSGRGSILHLGPIDAIARPASKGM